MVVKIEVMQMYEDLPPFIKEMGRKVIVRK